MLLELPCIILRTKDKEYFPNCDDYGAMTDSELETLLQQSRDAVTSLQTELENRQKISDDPPDAIKRYCEKLRKSARNIKILERLDTREARLTNAAVDIMTTGQTKRSSKIYRDFLFDIKRHCGPALALLCAASFGKQKVIDLNGQDRTALVYYIKSNKSALFSSSLGSLAEEYRIPSMNAQKADIIAEEPLQGEDQQESSDGSEGDSDEAEFETNELPATEIIAAGASNPLQPPKRRHIEDEQETVQLEGSAERGTQRRGPKTGGADTQQLQKRQKEIEYRYSEAPISQMWLFGERIFEAVQSSHQWKWERELGGPTTDCLNALVPKNRSQDISITLVVGHEKGGELIEKFMLSPL